MCVTDEGKKYRLFLASPRGLEPERLRLAEVVTRVNARPGPSGRAQFELVEGVPAPSGGEAISSKALRASLEGCDFFIFLLEDRWGTLPEGAKKKNYQSATEEAYYAALAASLDKKRPMRALAGFFREVDERRLSDPGKQLRTLIKFRKKQERKGRSTSWVFDGLDQFGAVAERQLLAWAQEVEDLIGQGAMEVSPLVGLFPKEVLKKADPELKEAMEAVNDGWESEAEELYAPLLVRGSDPLALESFGQFMIAAGRHGRAEKIFGRLLALGEARAEPAWSSRACLGLGRVFQLQGRILEADTMVKEGLERAGKAGNKSLAALATRRLGDLRKVGGAPEEAETHYKQALKLLEGLDEKEALVEVYGNLGLISRQAGDLALAETLYRRCLKIDEALGGGLGVAAACSALGNIFLDRGDLDPAEEVFTRGLEIHEDLGDKRGMAKALGNLGNVFKDRGEVDEAEALYYQSLEMSESLGHLEGMAAACDNLGDVFRLAGKLEEAEAMHRRGLALDQARGSKEGMAFAYGNLGNIRLARGDKENARALYAQSVTLFQEVGNAPLAAMVRERLAGLTEAQHPG